MNRFTALACSSLLLLTPLTGFAQETALNLCTGSKAGTYYPTGEKIVVQASKDLKINVIETNGSSDNLRKLSNRECDAAIIQADAYFATREENSRLNIERTTELYDEYVHLICNRESGVGDVGDLEDHPERYVLMVGEKGSGTALTWRTFTMLDKDYAKVPTLPIGGAHALAKVMEGREAQCMMYIGGLRSPAMMKFDEQGESLKLVEVDDGDFNDKKDDAGHRIYEFTKIPSGTYDKMQGSFFGSIETLKVKSVLITDKRWIQEHQAAYSSFVEAALAARPHVLKMVGQLK